MCNPGKATHGVDVALAQQTSISKVIIIDVPVKAKKNVQNRNLPWNSDITLGERVPVCICFALLLRKQNLEDK